MEIDLNQPAQQVLIDDPQEVIVNPAQPVPAGDFLELNDFIEEVGEEVQEIAVPLPPPIPKEENLLDLANQVQEQEVAPLQFPLNPVNVWVEEVPLDQLVEFEDDGFPDPDQLVGPGEEGFPIEQMEVEDAHIEEEEQQVFHQNLNIGLVLHNHWDVDPALLDWEKGKTVEATRLWANFFSRGNADCLHVKIPSAWSNFFYCYTALSKSVHLG